MPPFAQAKIAAVKMRVSKKTRGRLTVRLPHLFRAFRRRSARPLQFVPIARAQDEAAFQRGKLPGEGKSEATRTAGNRNYLIGEPFSAAPRHRLAERAKAVTPPIAHATLLADLVMIPLIEILGTGRTRQTASRRDR